jgi:hypothetical protein
MKIGVSISIDVQKIMKDRLHKGAKGTYLDLTTFIDTQTTDQYDNHGFISQSQTKEERESGADRTPILGNCKVFWSDGESQGSQVGSAEVTRISSTSSFEDSDIPF